MQRFSPFTLAVIFLGLTIVGTCQYIYAGGTDSGGGGGMAILTPDGLVRFADLIQEDDALLEARNAENEQDYDQRVENTFFSSFNLFYLFTKLVMQSLNVFF